MQPSYLFIIIYLLALADLYNTATCPAGTIVTGSYQSTAMTSTVSWMTDCTKQTIQLNSTFTAAKVGWVSVGWNTVSTMNLGDVAFAWLDSTTGTQYIYDTTNTNHKAPTTDTYSYTNASITAKGTTTTLSFTRSWATTDPTDIAISPTATLYLMIAMYTANPTNNLIANAATHSAYDNPLINFFEATASTTIAATASTTIAATTTGSATVAPGSGSSASGCAAGDSFSGQYANAAGSFTVTWVIDCSTSVFSAIMAAKGTGWVSFGLNPTATSMAGAYLLQATVVSGVVSHLDGYASSHNAPKAAATDIYLQVNGTDDGTTTTIGFSRPLTAASDTDISVNGNNMVWAFHSTSDDFTVIHDSQLALSINFFTGATSTPANLQLVHGTIMMIAWGFLAVLGTFIARYLKNIGHLWYRVHLACQYSVLILTVIGFIIIVKEVGPIGSDHFTSAHAVLGLLIFLGTFAQVALGILSNRMWKPDREGTPAFPDKIHWWLGRTIILLGIVNIFLGYDLYGYTGVDYGPIIAFAVWISIVYMCFVGVDMAMGQIHHHSSDAKTVQDIIEENKVPLTSYGIMLFTGIILVAVNLHEIWDNPPPPA